MILLIIYKYRRCFISWEHTQGNNVLDSLSKPSSCSHTLISLWLAWLGMSLKGILFVYNFTTAICDLFKRYPISTFENYEIFALSKSEFNKLSNDTRFIKRKCYFWSYEKKMVYISILSLYFTIYFAPYLKTSLADLWWCVTFNILFPNQDIRLSHHITYIFYHVIRLLSNNMDFIIVQPNCFQNHF